MSSSSTITASPDHEPALGRTNSAIGGTGKVPNAQKPRSRPATSLRDKVARHLPPYSGPYSVGSMEIEVPVEAPRTFSNITRDGRHLLQLETVLFTLYYPAAIGSGTGKDPAGIKKWSRETWLPRPRLETVKGYARFAGIPEPLMVPFCGATSMFAKLRGYRNASPATHWPPEGNSKRRGYKLKNEQGPPPSGAPKEPEFPLLIFSHGLGGTRTAYSTMCGEFASYGFVVCALEHRDGSGPRTFVNHARPGEEGEQTHEASEKVDHSAEEDRQGCHKVDYIFPKGNPYDTSPNNETGVDGELRNAQIKLRLAEIEEAYRVLRTIAEGNGEEIARQNRRAEGYIGGSSRGLKGVDWSAWRKRFHVDRITVAGHSFGAATVVEVLRNADRFGNVQAGIIYDIWGAPIKPPAEDARHRIHAPLLGINSEAFMYWQTNFDAVMALMEEAKEQGAPAFLCTVRGSVHISQSDFTVLYNHLCSVLLKATVHPQRAIDLNISASLEFLRDVGASSSGKSIIERCLTDEEILQLEPLEQVPDDQKPDQEFIAAKLKVPHEFKTRVAASLQRKLKRQKVHGFYNPGDEMWMHFKPTEEELREWQQGKKGKQEIEEDSQDEPRGESSSSDEGGDGVSRVDGNWQENWLGHAPALKDTPDMGRE